MEEKTIVFWTEKAKSDLRNLYDYYCEEVSEEHARDIVGTLLLKTRVLMDYPLLGAKEPYLGKLKLEYRRLIERNCKIIYRVSEKRIYINRVFDTRQNPSKLKVK